MTISKLSTQVLDAVKEHGPGALKELKKLTINPNDTVDTAVRRWSGRAVVAFLGLSAASLLSPLGIPFIGLSTTLRYAAVAFGVSMVGHKLTEAKNNKSFLGKVCNTAGIENRSLSWNKFDFLPKKIDGLSKQFLRSLRK